LWFVSQTNWPNVEPDITTIPIHSELMDSIRAS
jgi:hypothetical protein